MRVAWAARRERLPRDHGHLALLHASMSYLRQFAPPVLGAVRFAGGPGTDELMAALEMLCELYATGTRKVPADAPIGFVPTRWQGYLTTAADAGDVTAYRHYWELCVLLALRDGLRCGDVFVPGSRRYADPTQFLLTTQQWQPRRVEYAQLVDKPLDAGEAIEGLDGLSAAPGRGEFDVTPGPVRVDILMWFQDGSEILIFPGSDCVISPAGSER